MHAGLSTEKAPAFSVPIRFFLTGPLFGVAAAVVLLWNGPNTLEERWSPTALALTHFMTLGYLALTMVGAMTQMLAVLGGSPVPRSRGIGRLTHVLLVAGTLLLTGGFLSGGGGMFRPAVIILLVGLGAWAYMGVDKKEFSAWLTIPLFTSTRGG